MSNTFGTIVIEYNEAMQELGNIKDQYDIGYIKLEYIPAPGASHTATVSFGMLRQTTARQVNKYMLTTTVGEIQRAQTKLALGAKAFSKVELKRI